MRRSLALATILACALAAACDRAPEPPPTLVLITVDTLRADRLSAYGYAGNSTPNIDRLAADGVLFENAQAVASWTLPNIGAMLTSRYPRQIGAIEREEPGRTFGVRDTRTADNTNLFLVEAPTLAEILAERGYRRAAFVNQPLLDFRYGYARGFDDWFYPDDDGSIVERQPDSEAPERPWSNRGRAAEIDRGLIRAFDGWLERHAAQGRPVFAWLHLLLPHRPYNPRRGELPKRLTAAECREATQHLDAEHNPINSACYDAEVQALDRLIGVILRSLERHADPARTAIVFTSDHGEEFGEHGGSEHGHSLHREVLRVPLIVRAPRLPAGKVVDQRVRLLDIAPTVLEIAGLPASPERTFEGESLLPLVERGGRDLPLLAEGMLYGGTKRSLSDGRYKLIVDEQAGVELLYDLEADPGEETDLRASQPEVAERLRERLETLSRRLEASRDQDAGPPGARREPSVEAMRALGYLSDEDETPAAGTDSGDVPD